MPKRVLVSYSHDSPEHRERVRELAVDLEDRGLEVVIDQDQPEFGPPEGWPTWTAKQIRAADWIVMVFTATYARRFEGEETPGVGHGATFEGKTLRQMFYEAGSQRGKLVPVVLGETSIEDVVPTELRGLHVFRLPRDLDDLSKGLRRASLPLAQRVVKAGPTRRKSLALVALLGVIASGLGAWRWFTTRPNLDVRVQALQAGLTTGALAYGDSATDAPKAALRSMCLDGAVHYRRLGLDAVHCDRLLDTEAIDLVAGLRLDVSRRCDGLTARAYRAGLALGNLLAAGAAHDDATLDGLYDVSRFVIQRQHLPGDVLGHLPLERPPAEALVPLVATIEGQLEDTWTERLGRCDAHFDDELRYAAYELGRSLSLLVTSLPFVATSSASMESFETNLLNICRRKNRAANDRLSDASGRRALVDCAVLSKAIRRAARNDGKPLEVLDEAILDLEPHFAAAIVDAFTVGRWMGQSLLLAGIAGQSTRSEANAAMLAVYARMQPELNLQLEQTDLRTRFPEAERLGDDDTRRIARWQALNESVDAALKARWGPPVKD